MAESVADFMERKHDPFWTRRLRKALAGYMPTGIRLPGEPARDARGRFKKAEA